MAKALATESLSHIKSLRAEFESKTQEVEAQNAELKMQLQHQKTMNEHLETRIEQLTAEVRSIRNDVEANRQAQDQGRQAQLKALKDDLNARNRAEKAETEKTLLSTMETKAKEATQDLVSRDELGKALRAFDETLAVFESAIGDKQEPMPGDQTARRLRSALSNLESLLCTQLGDMVLDLMKLLEKLQQEVDDHGVRLKKHTDQHTEASAAIKIIESSVAKLCAPDQRAGLAQSPVKVESSTHQAASDHDDVKQITRAEVNEQLRNFLPTLVEKFSGYLQDERVKREAVAKDADAATSNISMLRSDLDSFKKEYEASLEQLARHNVDLASHDQSIRSLESGLPTTGAEIKPELDELAMQVRDVQSWQNNFTTRPLYRDIVEHINATLPNGVAQQLRTLTARLESFEHYFETTNAGAYKKRRLNPDGSTTTNGDS
ncbi:hypothetical protein CDD83_10730 [Cordyceps sp. RAO-2017]|nr:hypothetical protein CDD83_10730 [Cordyceps sp. RAO-2017]